MNKEWALGWQYICAQPYCALGICVWFLKSSQISAVKCIKNKSPITVAQGIVTVDVRKEWSLWKAIFLVQISSFVKGPIQILFWVFAFKKLIHMSYLYVLVMIPLWLIWIAHIFFTFMTSFLLYYRIFYK